MANKEATASRNRTLTLTDDERSVLRSSITHISPAAQGFIQLPIDIPAEGGQLFCADLLSAIDLIPDGVADLIIIDPPYNLTRDFGEVKFNARTPEKYDAYLRTWFHRVCQKLSPRGSLYMCGDWRCTSALQRVMEEELTIINRITWQREKGRGAQRNWKNAMEDIWMGVRNPLDYTFNVDAVMQRRRVIAPYRKDDGAPKDWEDTEDGKFRTTYPSNFWDDMTVPFWSMPENTDHPTQKPEKLYAKLILASSRPGDLVFDPFMGSGTACVVAQKLGRRYLGIEINEEYCLWAAKRLAMAQEDSSIQGYSDGVFWERNSGISKRK